VMRVLKAKTKRTGKERSQVVRVAVEVRSGAARFRVGVQASSIRRAVSLVKGLYSASDIKVLFPIDPEGFW
jgi:dihydrodipicolinate synthase/N-acetylneuraminate lyase